MARFLLDRPYHFFRKEHPGWKRTLFYSIIISAVFSGLNQLSIFFKLTNIALVYGHAETFLIIFISLVTGFFIMAIPLAVMSFSTIDSKKYLTALFVLAYSATPFMLFGWIPHAAVKIALLIWSFVFLVIGINIKMKKTYKRAVAITLAIVLITIAISLLSQNFILAPV